jgi:membrane associated rhomboid family serine protease
MNLQEQRSSRRIGLGTDGNALVNLVVVNIVLFVLLKFIYVIYQLSNMDLNSYVPAILSWFTLPARLEVLGLRPWTLISYMFTHENLLHILGNMLWLWMFGYIMQDMTGNRRLAPAYLLGGLAAGLAFVLAWQFVPGLNLGAGPVLLGANASILAVAIAATAIAPDYRIFPMISGGIPLWIITAIYVIINFAGMPPGSVPHYLAQIAGAGMGFLYIYLLRRGRDIGAWINSFFDWFDNLFNPDKPASRPKKKEHLFYKTGGQAPYKKIPHITQQRIDQILDKINQEGYHMLTEEEKEILKRAANEEEL